MRTRALMVRVATLGGLALLLLGGCAGDESGSAVDSPAAGGQTAARNSRRVDPFSEVATRTGLDFLHFNGMSGEYYMVENMGAGVALLDYDNDGDLDVYVIQGHMLGPGKSPRDAVFPWSGSAPLRDRLFRNDLTVGADGKRILAFADVTADSRIDGTGYGIGAATGDFDNDGRVDLYVTNFGPNRLLHNNGDGTFTDVSDVSGTADPLWSASAAFLDFDRDGWLDLYVGNYLNYSLENDKDCFSPTGEEDYCAPTSYLPVPDRLYRNLGNGTFEDVTAASGIARDLGAALGVVAADFNGDGWIDIYVANDGLPNVCWINQRDRTFRNTALLAGCALNASGKEEASMGVDAADFDEDGDEDLFMTHLTGETNTIYVNDGRGIFEDRSTPTGLGPPSQAFTGFGAAWLDYDNDGRLDILTVNGAVKTIESLARQRDPYPLHQRNQLFRNLGNTRYQEVSVEAGVAFELSEVSRGAAVGDIDNDGDVDLLVSNNSGTLRLLINNAGGRNHWIGLRMIGMAAPRDMLGTRVGVFTRSGRTLWRRVRADGSYASANDPRLLLGLGDETEIVKVRAEWPGGLIEEWLGVPVDRWTELREGSGQTLADGMDER